MKVFQGVLESESAGGEEGPLGWVVKGLEGSIQMFLLWFG